MSSENVKRCKIYCLMNLPAASCRVSNIKLPPPLMGGDKGEGEQTFYHPIPNLPHQGEDYMVTL